MDFRCWKVVHPPSKGMLIPSAKCPTKKVTRLVVGWVTQLHEPSIDQYDHPSFTTWPLWKLLRDCFSSCRGSEGGKGRLATCETNGRVCVGVMSSQNYQLGELWNPGGWCVGILILWHVNYNLQITGKLGGGNSNIFGIFTPKFGDDDSHFDEHIFQLGWNMLKPPTGKWFN